MQRTSLTLLVLSLSLTLTAIDRANAGAGGESQSPKVENLIDERVFEKIAPAGANNPCPKFFDWIPNPLGYCRESGKTFRQDLGYFYRGWEVINIYACRFNEEEYSEWLSRNGTCPDNSEMEIHHTGFACSGASTTPLAQQDEIRCPTGHTAVIDHEYESIPPYRYHFRYRCERFPNFRGICGGHGKKMVSSGNNVTQNVVFNLDSRSDEFGDEIISSYCCATIGPEGE